jgi:hypothetical protein
MHGLQWDCSLIPATTREDIVYIDKWSMCVPDVLLKLDSALSLSLHPRGFLDSSFLRDLLAVSSAWRLFFWNDYFKGF